MSLLSLPPPLPGREGRGEGQAAQKTALIPRLRGGRLCPSPAGRRDPGLCRDAHYLSSSSVTLNRQGARNARSFIIICFSWRPWRLGGSRSYSFCWGFQGTFIEPRFSVSHPFLMEAITA